jgi:hypothetical protein
VETGQDPGNAGFGARDPQPADKIGFTLGVGVPYGVTRNSWGLCRASPRQQSKSATTPKYKNITTRNATKYNNDTTQHKIGHARRSACLAGVIWEGVVLCVVCFCISELCLLYFGVVADFDCCLGDARHNRNSWGPFASPGEHPGLGGASPAQVSRKFGASCAQPRHHRLTRFV